MYCNNHVDKSKNKVYINPNFHRTQANNYPMHVNPRFNQFMPIVPVNLNNTSRIHINPNFRQSKSVDIVVDVNGSSTNINFIQYTPVPNSLNYWHAQEQLQVANQVVVPDAKSRYCLVRNNVNTVSKEPVLEKSKTTIQINKYKSVPLHEIKKKLDNAKNAVSEQMNVVNSQIQHQNDTQPTNKNNLNSSTMKRNKFKLVNNKAPVVRNSKIRMRTLIDKHKKVQSNQLRLNRIKGNLKKNNIPCPMFRKFGKCLRKEHGNCEFLHDKKHVSVCRKFIKGLCHDKDCLLSHDLTMKKMPTCYFYLKGKCTKPECPYLHVKLNEKTKVCPDFLKGYCEKGSKCLQRHCYIRPGHKVTNSLITSSSTSRKNAKLKLKKLDSEIKKTTTVKSNETTLERYYQDNKDDNEIYENIKPMRCKLGSLPSFIQL